MKRILSILLLLTALTMSSQMKGQTVVAKKLTLPYQKDAPLLKTDATGNVIIGGQPVLSINGTILPDGIGNINLPLPDLSNYVPYTGATSDVDLGVHKLTLGINEVETNGTNSTFIYFDSEPIFRLRGESWFMNSGIGFGRNAIRYSSASFINGFGRYSQQYSSGGNTNGFGDSSLEYNSSHNSNGFGTSALRYSSGITGVNGFGSYSLYSNRGQDVNGVGNYSLEKNTGNDCSGIGASALHQNVSNNSLGFGTYTLNYNDKPDNIAIGHYANSGFTENSSAAKAVADASVDIDIVTNRITIISHGFGTPGAYVNLRYTASSNPLGGLTNYIVYRFKIISSNTIECLEDITSVGTNTHTFTPQYSYNNTICLGSNSTPTKNNQVVLGNNSTGEVYTNGVYATEQYYKIKAVSLPTLSGTDRAIALDSSDNKLKFWNGTSWNLLY